MSSGKLYLESNAQFWRLTVKYEINILKVFSSFVEHNEMKYRCTDCSAHSRLTLPFINEIASNEVVTKSDQ